MLRRLGAAVVPAEIVVALGEINVLFVGDGCPLEGRSCFQSTPIHPSCETPGKTHEVGK